ncbi:transcriptional regulator, AraC family [Filimonas lacunae]|uniref:Transcriptional regulator, AraC family n=1 Tax=Filimonas lacunae TaxID=477680 RepID=A0A173MH39_9BACT|nr:response regulator transcription factor [Filimonas lacunae]BAV06809.1 transcriptional regulator, AraC family [Filimonas lacunae]SIS99444.1 transcriptional regulator, AraC family [Filimonas lacunae]
MYFLFGLRSSLLLIFFTHLVVYAFLFWKRGIKQERLADRLLGTFLFLSALFIFPWMAGFAGWYDTQPYRDILFYTPFIHALCFGPLLYLYLKSLTNNGYRITRKDWLHFLPGGLYVLWSVVVAVTDKWIVKDYYLMNGYSDPDFDSWYSFTWSLSLLTYLIFAIRYYRQYITFSQYEFSFAYEAGFKWLRNFLYLFSMLTILLLSEQILSLFINLHYIRSWYYFFAFALMVYYMAITGYNTGPVPYIKLNFQPQLLLEYRAPLLLDYPQVTVSDQPEAMPEWMNEWKQLVMQLVEVEKVYTDPELTLTQLARQMNTNASLLSKVINTCFRQNFNDFINYYRVQETIRLMQSDAHRHLNLLVIAYEAGFNSKSTFNRAFKKVTGKTPGDYPQAAQRSE